MGSANIEKKYNAFEYMMRTRNVFVSTTHLENKGRVLFNSFLKS